LSGLTKSIYPLLQHKGINKAAFPTGHDSGASKKLSKPTFEIDVVEAHKTSNAMLKKAQEKKKRRFISRTLATIMERNKIL